MSRVLNYNVNPYYMEELAFKRRLLSKYRSYTGLDKEKREQIEK